MGIDLGLVLAGLVYGQGWRRWSQGQPVDGSRWRLASFWLGLILVGAAWSGWLSQLTARWLIAHMVQHLLLMLAAPPLLLLGAPLRVLAQAMPRAMVPRGGDSRLAPRLGRWAGRWLAHPVRAGGLMVLVTLGWHLPWVFALAMGSSAWHAVENLTFLVCGLLFWWPVILPWPGQRQWPRWTVPLYLLCADLPVSAMCAYLAFCGHVVYPAYASAGGRGAISALDDQVAAAMLMWVAMLVVFLAAAVVVVMDMLKPAHP